MTRALWKFAFAGRGSIKTIIYLRTSEPSKNKKFYTFERKSSVLTPFIDSHYTIYNGNTFSLATITNYKTFLKFGELSFTRKPFSFSKRPKKLKKLSSPKKITKSK